MRLTIALVFSLFTYAFAQPFGPQSLTFCVLGDFGGTSLSPYTTQNQLNVAVSMGPLCSSINSQFTITVGDNIYDSGATSEYDPRFNVSFEQVYTHPYFYKPWWLVPGNRDYDSSNVTAEILYSAHSARWNMPGLFYEKLFSDQNGVPLLQLLMIDTWDLTSASKGPSYPAQDLAGKGQAVLNFLKLRLSPQYYPNNPYIWRIVVSHYPIFSSGAHGPNNTDLISELLPILTTYGADSYFAGHDHSLQHLQKPCSAPCTGKYNFFMFGPGSQPENNEDGYVLDPTARVFQFPTLASVQNMGGYGSVTVNHTHMTVYMYREDAVLLYSYTMPAQRAAAPPVTPTPTPTTTTGATSTTGPSPSTTTTGSVPIGAPALGTASALALVLAVFVALNW